VGGKPVPKTLEWMKWIAFRLTQPEAEELPDIVMTPGSELRPDKPAIKH
jgi:hypothetical protein